MSEREKKNEAEGRRQVISVATESGSRDRINEDAVFPGPGVTSGLYVGVFDGVSGRSNGEVASKTAARVIRGMLASTWPHLNSLHEVAHIFEHAWYETKNALLTKQTELGAEQPLATTAVVAALFRQENDSQIVYAHAGDSSLFTIKENGSLIRMTHDENLAYYDLLMGRISFDQYGIIEEALDRIESKEDIWAYQEKLKELVIPIEREQLQEEQGYSPYINTYWSGRNVIINSLSSDTSSSLLPDKSHFANLPTISSFQISPQDVGVLLMSDGISDQLSIGQMEKILREGHLETLPQRLINGVREEMKQSFSKPNFRIKGYADDMTAAVMLL